MAAAARRAWYERYGVTPSRLREREHAPDELAHYAKKAIDVEYRFPFGWKELEGVHNRGDFDLSRHSEASRRVARVLRPGDRRARHPVDRRDGRPAPDRAAFTFLIDAYREEEVRGETRVSLALHPDLAPYKVAVLPLLKKRPEIVALCHAIKDDLKRHTMAVYDDTAAIGKLYRRQDEIGTPWCVTVDVDSLEDDAVTVRDRDSMTQERVPVEGVTRLILDRLEAARALVRSGSSEEEDRGRRAQLDKPQISDDRHPSRRWTMSGSVASCASFGSASDGANGDVAASAGISQSAVSLIERGHLASMSIRVLRRVFATVDARYEGPVTWRGGLVDRLLDERHARLVGAFTAALVRLGWEVHVEVTFSEFGERGSIDILALRRPDRIALVVEIKSD